MLDRIDMVDLFDTFDLIEALDASEALDFALEGRDRLPGWAPNRDDCDLALDGLDLLVDVWLMTL